MDNSKRFEKLRKEYKEFWYNSYDITENEDYIILNFEFEIPGLTKFNPSTKILKKNFKFKNINTKYAKNMVFNIGLIELISYWKATCSKNVIIKCGYLDEEQIKWWKKLYYNGLGELRYRNNIKVEFEDFMNITTAEKNEHLYYDCINNDTKSEGYIVPIGGGKDSCVSLETLNLDKNRDYTLIINPKPVTLKCAELAGFSRNNVIEIIRTIDKNLITLNSEGYINGHTPFSAMLAFTSYFVAYLLSRKYIALSNENSANESNVVGENINHQYSKSFEFECDFLSYSNKYLMADVKYFSFLRPLNELQIAMLFSRLKKYHKVFKSCNVGSKEKEWIWCCNCAKCLFAYTILSPYLYKDEIIEIFGEDLFEKESLKDTFIDLCGYGNAKPFDCVGTFEEVNFAISKTIQNIKNNNMHMPYLLKYYIDNYSLVDTTNDITKRYNENNNLTKEQDDLLRKEVFFR